jgi:ribonuclease HI
MRQTKMTDYYPLLKPKEDLRVSVSNTTKPNMPESVEVYTDGSCLGNPGKGGWGAIIKWDDGESQVWGSSAHSTNNEMELTAIYNACLELNKNSVKQATIYTDSNYAKRGITEWMPKWRTNGYKSSANKPIKNMEIWKLLDEEQQKIDHIEWKHVKAHNGDVMNERVDKLARESAENQ